jgi:hypothetical protein
MLQTNTTYQPGLALELLGTQSSVHQWTDERVAVRREEQSELAMDDALEASFPASDPPAWNPGMARPIPVARPRNHANDIRPTAARDESVNRTPGVIDVSRPSGSERTLLKALISVAGAAGIALLLPFALLVALPFALAARGLLEVRRSLVPAIG